MGFLKVFNAENIRGAGKKGKEPAIVENLNDTVPDIEDGRDIQEPADDMETDEDVFEESLEDDSSGKKVYYGKKEDLPQRKPRLDFTGMSVIAGSMRVIGGILPPENEADSPEKEKEPSAVPEEKKKPVIKENGLISRHDMADIINGTLQEQFTGESMPDYIERDWLMKQMLLLPVWNVPETCAPGQPGACRNEVELSGKIIALRHSQNGGVAFMLSCGFRGMKYDREGRPVKDIITLVFSKQQMKQYSEYKVGDRVIAGGIIQNMIDRRHPVYRENDSTPYYPSNAVCLGLWMERGVRRNIGRYDYNAARITGSIISTTVAKNAEGKPNGWLFVRIKTVVRRIMPGQASGSIAKTREYVNKPSVRVFVGENDAELVAKNTLTPGTWVDVNGRIFGRIKTSEEEKEERRA